MAFKFTWYGHAAMGLETGGYHLLVDPYLSENPAASTTPDKVPADFILITHGHYDHVGDAVEIAKRTGAMVISNFEIATWFAEKGIQSHEQHIGGGCDYPFGHVKLTPALHGSKLPDGSNGGNPAGFLISTKDGKKVYISGDTGLFSDMKLIGEEGLDLATLPIGDNYTMGPADALKAVRLLAPKNVIPVHYNTFDLIKQDANAWAKRVEAETEAHVHVLKPGESWVLEKE